MSDKIRVLLSEEEVDVRIKELADQITKESEKNEDKLNRLDETELMVSNLYYSLFASPLELADNKQTQNKNALQKSLELVNNLEKNINIPEYNRLVTLIKNNLQLLIMPAN